MNDYARKGTDYGPDMNMGTRPATFPDKMEGQMLRGHEGHVKREPDFARLVNKLDGIHNNFEKTIMMIEEKMQMLSRFSTNEPDGRAMISEKEEIDESTVLGVMNNKINRIGDKHDRLVKIHRQLSQLL